MNETVFAVGGGGYNLATDFIKAGLFEDAQFIVCDTNPECLEKISDSSANSYLLDRFGNQRVSSGRRHWVDHIVKSATDTIVICSTLGGQTGSKYAPLIALNAILSGKKVYSIVTLPYSYERENRSILARKALYQMYASSHLTICQLNEKLFGDLNLTEMNKPLVDTVKNILTKTSFSEIAETAPLQYAQKYVPEHLVSDNLIEPLISIRPDSYRGIKESDRCEVFDCWVK